MDLASAFEQHTRTNDRMSPSQDARLTNDPGLSVCVIGRVRSWAVSADAWGLGCLAASKLKVGDIVNANTLCSGPDATCPGKTRKHWSKPEGQGNRNECDCATRNNSSAIVGSDNETYTAVCG